MDDRQQGVQAFERFAFNRHADYRQRRVAGNHAGQMCSAAGSGDDDSDASAFGGLGVARHFVGSAMGGDDFRFEGHGEFAADFGRGLHGGPVGIAAHDDADEWFGAAFHVVAPKIIWSEAACAIFSASATVFPSAVTWPIFRPVTLTALP